MKKLLALIVFVLADAFKFAVNVGCKLNYLSSDDSTALMTAYGRGVSGE